MKQACTILIILFLAAPLAACSAAPAIASAPAATLQAASTPADQAASSSAESALVDLADTHDEASDYAWDAAGATSIELEGAGISVDDPRVAVDGSTATITAAGTYILSGSLADGQIVVDSPDEDPVRLVLSGADISSSSSAPLFILNAGKAIIVLAEGTANTLTDAPTHTLADPETDEPNAALFSTADLTITGSGSLEVNGQYNDGIASKDGLIIDSGTLKVTAVDDGVRGKDYISVKSGDINIAAGGDGLKADNEEEASKGFINIESGTLAVTAGGDAIQAESAVHIAGGDFTLNAGGGSSASMATGDSAKGIKATGALVIEGGAFAIDSADDALNANDSIVLNGGSFTIASGDDALHADSNLTVNSGRILVSQAYEGLESTVITLNGGEIDLTTDDDGINVAAGNDGSGAAQPGGGIQRPGGPGMETFAASSDTYLYINGGTILVNARGDGLDVNGAIVMTGGVVVVSGPTDPGNGAVDYDRGFTLSGGVLAAAGSSGMAMAPDVSSSQASVLVYFTTTLPAGTLVHIQGSAGQDLLTFAPAKEYQSLAFSSPELSGGDYALYTGGSAAGESLGGLYPSGTYDAGSQYGSFTVSSTVTTVGSGGRMGGGRHP